MTARVKGDLLKIARGRTPPDANLEEATNLLQAWDNTVSRDSSGSMLFVTFWNMYRQNARPLHAVPFNERHPGATPYGIGDDSTAPPTAYSIVAYSTSDDPKLPHHSDQSILFAQEKWKRAWFTEEDIAKHTERSYHP